VRPDPIGTNGERHNGAESIERRLFIFALFVALGGLAQTPCGPKSVPIAAWRIYYSDRQVTSRQATWEKAPDDDVQVVVFYYAETYERWNNGVKETIHYRKVCQGVDNYWYGGCGAVEEATAQQVKRGVKRGKWTTDAKWDAIIRVAEAEEKLP